jgi:hypothetical protein
VAENIHEPAIDSSRTPKIPDRVGSGTILAR